MPSAAARAGRRGRQPPRLDGVRVLLAEDNEINRLVASELLEQAGCDCTMAVNGREAVDEAACATPDDRLT